LDHRRKCVAIGTEGDCVRGRHRAGARQGHRAGAQRARRPPRGKRRGRGL